MSRLDEFTMGLMLCLVGFAATYAGATFVGSWIDVSAFGGGDLKFGDVAGNLRFVAQVLPIVTAIATLSAFFGARSHQAWLRDRAWRAFALGSGAGALTAAAFFALAEALMLGPGVLPQSIALAVLFCIRILILGVPAAVTCGFIRYMRRRASDGR